MILYSDNDFSLHGDYKEGVVVLHCEVQRWTAAVYRRILAALLGVQQAVKDTLYAPRIDDKQEKFMRMFGFTPSDVVMLGSDGKTYALFKKEDVCPR